MFFYHLREQDEETVINPTDTSVIIVLPNNVDKEVKNPKNKTCIKSKEVLQACAKEGVKRLVSEDNHIVEDLVKKWND